MADETIRGGRALAQALATLAPKIEKNIMRAALRAGGNVIRDDARQYVPVKYRKLWRSIRVSTGAKGGTVKATVKAGDRQAFYAHMVEYGTKKHLIKVDESEKPINYRLTRKRGVLTRASMRTVNRNVLQIGNTFVGPTVEHPGAKESPYMRPALDNGAQRALAATAAKARERLTLQGINVPAPEVE